MYHTKAHGGPFKSRSLARAQYSTGFMRLRDMMRIDSVATLWVFSQDLGFLSDRGFRVFHKDLGFF